jgi:glycerophosphoryl diester phosphodiesterase
MTRTTNATGKLLDYTSEQLKSIDAGQGEKIPTFAELITYAKPNNVHLLLELKLPASHPGLEEKCLKLLESQKMLENTMIESFDFDSLDKVHKLRPHFNELGALFIAPVTYFKVPPYCKYVVPMAETLLLFPWILWDAHRKGKKVYVWFAFYERLIIRPLIWLGVDGVIPDFPKELPELKQ